MKRIAIVLFAFGFVALPARADGIKAVAGTLGMGAISSVLCVLTVLYGPDDEEESPNEGFDRRGFFIGAGGAFAGENFSDKPVNDIADIFSNQPDRDDVPILAGPDTTGNADDSRGASGYGGYRCHPRYSVAARVDYFGGFDTTWTGVLNLSGVSEDIDIFAVGVDIKGYLLTGRYQPYVLVGGSTVHIDTEVTNPTGINRPWPFNVPVRGPVVQSRNYTDFAFRLGGGFDVYATDHVVVNIGASYMFPLGEVSGVQLFTVGGGIEYRF